MSFTKDDLTTALTAELGGDTLVEKSRQIVRRQGTVAILELDSPTAEGLLDKRYIGLNHFSNILLRDEHRRSS